jgi:hypothetical protein
LNISYAPTAFPLTRLFPFFGILLVLIGIAPAVQAQPEKEKPARILFLLDGSSSMLYDWEEGKESRFTAAAQIIGAIADSIHQINSDVEFGIRVFGHQHNFNEKNCYDSKLEVGFSKRNVEQIKTRLSYLSPRGYSPIAWSLKKTALEDFKDYQNYSYSIILITDGGESCGGDICATVTALLDQKISFRPYILSMIDYAPLKAEYDCLGKFLTVAKQADVVPAINTIIEDNRKILTIKSSSVRPTPTTAAPTPNVVTRPVVSAPVTKPAPKPPVITEPVVQPKPVSEPVVKIDTPKTVTPVPTLPPPPAERARPLVAPIKPLTTGKKRKMNILYALSSPNPVKVRPLPKFKNLIPEDKPVTPAPAAPQPKPKPKPSVSIKSTPKPPADPQPEAPSKYTEKSEAAKESQVKIYFTNGEGKYYATEPEIVITDNATGKQVLRGYRTVSRGAGEPDPILLPPGNYSLVVPGGSTNVPSFTIAPAEAKRLEIVIHNSTLAFEYPTNPKRPVKEYVAMVSKRFEAGPLVKQRGDERLQYEPANYHIEVNTLPPTLRNVDLTKGALTVVAIDEPGSIAISNTNRIGRVEFWYPLGDRYVRFYEMNIAGEPSLQTADFRPGPYEVRYIKPSTGNTEVIPFRVKRNETTTLELQP